MARKLGCNNVAVVFTDELGDFVFGCFDRVFTLFFSTVGVLLVPYFGGTPLAVIAEFLRCCFDGYTLNEPGYSVG